MNPKLAVSIFSTYCWETVAISNCMFGNNIGIASGLKSGLCKAFSTQDIKWCSVDQHLCINTSNNDAVSYIGPSFNYTEAFSLL